MQITINDTNELSALDLKVLSALVGAEAAGTAVSAAKPAAKPEAKAPAAKPAPKAAAKPEPEVEAEPDEDVADEAETEADEDVAEATMKDAVALATQLVSGGEAAKVKAALSDLGAKRVSELKDGDISKFVAALS